MPERIHRKRERGWRMPEGAVNVARPSPFGNPFRVGSEYLVGSFDAPSVDVRCVWNAAEAVRLYREWIMEDSPRHAAFRERVRRELRGMNLACWCPLGQPCHADVLLELANAD